MKITLSELRQIIKSVIKEESLPAKGIGTPEGYGKAIFDALGSNPKISASKITAYNEIIPSTYNTYYLTNYSHSDKFGKDGIQVNFKGYYYEPTYNKKNTVTISFVIVLTNGLASKIRSCFVVNGKSESLEANDFNSSILPKIKNIMYNPNPN